MAWRQEGNDLVWSGGEQGIAPSPHKGTANIQNANISTESGEVMASFARFQESQTAISNGTLTASVSDGAVLLDAPASLQAGQWITVSASTIPSATTTATYLVVGGGGGGGSATTDPDTGGGGGGGGVLTSTFSPAVQSYAITVGDGGAAATVGEDSVIATVATAKGGGAGGSSGINGGNGGSGGGGGSGATTGGTGTVGQGSNGGTGLGGGNEAGGGGGGAGAVGGNAAGGNAGNGGNGVASSISGTSVTYGGGGGGGSDDGLAGTGGTGGGGTGNGGSTPNNGTNGLGGGGGGNAGTGVSGGRGGSGVVIISYPTGSMTATGGAITFSGGNTIHTFYQDGTFTVHSIAAAGQYFVSYKNSSNKIKLSAIYDPYGLYPIAHGTTGTATFSTLAVPAAGVAKATEKYDTATETEYRYYLLDSNSRVWVYDTEVYETTLANNGVGEAWMLPDPDTYSSLNFTGIAILNGWCLLVNNAQIYGKPTVDLGRDFTALTNARLNTPFPTHINPAFVGHQGKMYYGDGNYVGELFPTTSLQTGLANIQSYCSMTGSGTTGTITAVITGSVPTTLNASSAIARIPAVFFPTEATGVPLGLTTGTVYWIEVSSSNYKSFSVYTASTGGSALTITTSGTAYFNTFYPLEADASINGTTPLVQFSPQRVNLPAFERIQCFAEVGSTVLIGGITNTVYPWNQVDALPSGLIDVPESNVKTILNVNNMGFIFAGNKGNIYVTNNSTASLLTKVPDYCAGVPASPNTYIEPKFTWGDATFVRGRVYFSILDQTATKTGNCGGVWSFVPPQNFSYGQDTGIALRLENQNSYGSYNGMATLILANEEQDATGPQFWTSWQNSYSIATSTLFGIDQTDDVPVTTFIIETDLIPVGTFISKTTFQDFEFKLSTPLASGDAVALYWRVNSTDAWTAFTGQVNETGNIISGMYDTNFQNAQWLQLRVVLTTAGTAASSFSRLTELRIK